MKNFKKVLALVLAIATLLSFATVASAATADFKDAADIKYTEAVDVLSAIKVLEGYPADNTYKPAKNITREEAAKIIAIFANKSADISSLYTSANPFADEKGRWGESYVAYGYRAGIIAGKSATQFKPTANVKGTEFLKMVLVVLGYDQNKEGLVGSSWAVNTLELAKAKSLMAGLPSTWDANAALTRDEAAQIMLNALKAETVVYGQTVTNLVYNTATKTWGVTNATNAAAVYVSPNGAQNNYNHTLLAAGFGLTLADTQDAWGRPTHTWKKGTAVIGEYVDSDKLLATFNTAVTECDAAKAAGFTSNKVLKLFVNGDESTDTIRPTATGTKLGAQGRQTEVYTDRIVMIDTFLAKVTGVTEVKYDAAGHKVNNATITLTVYDRAVNHNNAKVTPTAEATQVVLESGANYTYAKGDYVLVNATTNATNNRITSGTVDATSDDAYAEIAGKATSVEGAQSIIWTNANQHTVEGTTYNDAAKFNLDEAGTSMSKYTWFLDSFGNVIGNVKVATVYSYGVVTSFRYAANVANNATDGTGKAIAKVRYMDGTENEVTVSSVKMVLDYATPTYTAAAAPVLDSNTASNMSINGTSLYVSIDTAANKNSETNACDIIDGHLFQIETKADGTVALTEVAAQLSDTDANKVKVTNKAGYITFASTSVRVDVTTKFLYATPYTAAGAYSVLKGNYEYKTADGANEIPTFKSVDRLDYVDANGDGVADYVYIIGVTADSESEGFVFGNNVQVAHYLDSDNVIYHQITLPTMDAEGKAEVVKTHSEDLANMLANVSNIGKLFYVNYVNGYAVKVTEIATEGTKTGAQWTYNEETKALTKATVDMPFAYDTNDATAKAVKVAVGATVSGKFVEALNGARYNVTDATVVIGGELTEGVCDKVLFITYKQIGDARVADKIYMTDKNKGNEDWSTTAITALDVAVTAEPSANAQLGTLTITTKVGTGADEKVVKNAVDATATWCILDTATGKLVEVDKDTFAQVGATYAVKVTVNSVNPSYTLAQSVIKVNGQAVTLYAGTSNVYYYIFTTVTNA